jgi:hypothetical protein
MARSGPPEGGANASSEPGAPVVEASAAAEAIAAAAAWVSAEPRVYTILLKRLIT